MGQKISKEADVRDYGTLNYDRETMAQTFGVPDMVKKVNEVYINNQKENSFIVTGKDGVNT